MTSDVRKTAAGLILFFLCALCFAKARAPQEAQGEKAKYGLKPPDYALPPGAVELKVESTFPAKEDENKGAYLAEPQGLCVSPHGLFYVSDVRNSEVYVFNKSGKYVRTLGRFGQGPGEFMMPSQLACTDDKVFVRDMGNRRLQVLDTAGIYQGGFKLFRDYISLIVHDGLIYAVPVFYVPPTENQDKCLIDVIDLQGKVVRSFGSSLDINAYDSMVLGGANLALSAKNELWVSFHCFPIVRKYSLDGKLLAEYRYSYGIVDKKDSFNKKMMAQRTKYAQVPYYFVNSACWATAEGLYLLGSSEKRVDILLLGDDGRMLKFYWLPLAAPYWCFGLFVHEDSNGTKFYALDSISASIEVYAPKMKE